MDQYDTSQLTEFPRFEPESSQSGVSTFFNKLWKFPMFSPGETGESGQKALTDGKVDSPAEDAHKQEDEDKSEAACQSPPVEFQGRSLQNVLRRISSLVALGSSSGRKYSDTELARYWMPDDISRECYECAARFGALRRRHHCRVCGQVFCSRCCCQRVPGQIFGCAGGLRVCTYCCRVVLSYLRENDAAGEICPDLRSLQETLQVKFPDSKAGGGAPREPHMFAREDESGARAGAESLADVLSALHRALPPQQHRYRLVRYSGVWRGSDVMQWVMDNTSHKTRAQARGLCQALVARGRLAAAPAVPDGAPQFAEYALYRPAPAPPHGSEDAEPDEEHTRLVESVSSYCLDLDLDGSSARLTKTAKPSAPEPKSPSSEEETPNADHAEGAGEAAGARLCPGLARAGREHLQLLMRQCLAAEALGAGWLPVLLPLCAAAAAATLPDLHSSDIDIRHYVQVKKLPDGHMSDCRLVPGVVLTKNVAHRGMPQEIDNPTVLLLDCSITYQRVEGKLTSLEPVLLQEREYLARAAARVAALRPALVLARGAVARGAAEALRGAGVALAVRVRERALRRAARALRADLVRSVDARIAVPRLGECRRFTVTQYPSKTLMSLEGCAAPQLGCCVLLRGAPLAELARVKRVVRFMLLACYHWRLESAFLADVGARAPAPGAFDDDLDDVHAERDSKEDDVITGEGLVEGLEVDEDQDKTNDVLPADEGYDNSQSGSRAEVSKSERSDVQSEENRANNDVPMSEKSDDKNEGNQADSLNLNDEGTVDKSEESRAKNEAVDNKGSEVRSKEERSECAFPDPPSGRAEGERGSCGVPIRDNSDPLRAPADDDVFLPAEDSLQADPRADRWSADDTVLSLSPLAAVAPPFLETQAGRRCALRRYFPRPLLRVPAPPRAPPPRARAGPRRGRVEPQEPHPFVARPIAAPADEPALRAALAHYRAAGCPHRDHHKPECPLHAPSVVQRRPAEPEPEPQPEPLEPNPLDPAQHQQLAVLLYSYSNKSANAPDFCVNPWIVTMELYGKHDITLGAFLDKYCFNSESRCPSSTCSVPVNKHVRRFVHGDACITVTCNVIGHSAVDKAEEQSRQVVFWSVCGACGAGRARALSRAARAQSLAGYLRARAAPGGRPRARACRHALPAHAHVFARHAAAACFRYTKIAPYSVSLPPDVIATAYDARAMRDALIAQLNDLVLRGHEALGAVPDAGAEQDYQAFKHHSEQIALALAQARPRDAGAGAAPGCAEAGAEAEAEADAEAVRALWRVADALTAAERLLRDAQDRWASPAPKPAHKLDVEEKSELEESTGDTENADAQPRDEREHAGGAGEEDEEKGDKKTVRQILSQLLSNKEASHQNGIIISSGLVPVVVQAGEIGSVIAATLASVTYQRSLRAQMHSNQAEGSEAEGSGRERQEADKGRAKSNDHIEVLLKDGLLCRVYYAPQFHRLRHALLGGLTGLRVRSARCCDDRDTDKSLCDIEESFIRALAHCVPWAAKGGKSGSTFCKTKDDRYVLKEMTKPEWQQFLEFAPHYFNYVNTCRSQQVPSLLARILGVYSVGGAGNGVLVMENVWYGHAGSMRFDLKGSSRHRLAQPHPLAVLLDANLLQLRWEQQLFVASHTGAVLFAGVDRDARFLAANSVMDYSLLLGVHGSRLTVGIIDYIRTFTWDKKLEHLVKKNLGSGQPTVVSPDEYARRFCAAARKYFLRAPEPWDHLMQPAPCLHI